MIVKDLLAHERKPSRLVLTARGRAVLGALLSRAGIKLPLDIETANGWKLAPSAAEAADRS
jgi:hypothetical protein